MSVLLFFFIRTSLCARIEREKRGREGTWICVYAFELNRIQSHILVNRFFLGTKPSRLGVLRAIRCARVPFGIPHRAVPERCRNSCPLSHFLNSIAREEREWLRYSLENECDYTPHIEYLRFASFFFNAFTQKVLLLARERRIGTLISAPPQSSVLCPLCARLTAAARKREKGK